MSLSGKGKIIRKKVALALYDVCARACVCVCVCVCWGVYGHQKGQKKHVTPRGLADQRLRLRLCNTNI